MGIIILNVLKVIGMIILVILAIVLFVLLSLLVIPIVYKVKASYEEKIEASATIKWLCFFIKVKVLYENVLHIRASICGITCYDNLKPKKEKKTHKTNRQDISKKTKTQSNRASSENKDLNKQESIQSDEKLIVNQRQGTQAITIETNNESNKIDQPIFENETIVKNKFTLIIDKIKLIIDKIKAIWHNILSKINNIKQKFINLKNKFRSTREQINFYVELLEQQETKDAFSLCIRQLVKILKHILPKKWKMYLTIGLEDSAMLGKILGIHGMFYPLIGNHVIIYPLWDEVIISGKVIAKGRISIIGIVVCALRLLIDKNIRNLMKVIRKGGNKNG